MDKNKLIWQFFSTILFFQFPRIPYTRSVINSFYSNERSCQNTYQNVVPYKYLYNINFSISQWVTMHIKMAERVFCFKIDVIELFNQMLPSIRHSMKTLIYETYKTHLEHNPRLVIKFCRCLLVRQFYYGKITISFIFHNYQLL